MTPWQRLKKLVVHQILGVADTPHRIAWGVFIGSVIAFTPTLGLQIVFYLTVATLLRANKVSGIPILFVSNPFTAVPLYWFTWKVGDTVMNAEPKGQSQGAAQVAERMREVESNAEETDLFTDIWTEEFWVDVGETLLAMGAELWVGGLIVGLITAVPCYFLTYWGVRAFRRAKGRH